MPQPEPSPRTQLKLKAAIGDALVLHTEADQRVELTLDQTRDRDASGCGASGGVGVRLILRDAAGNGIDAWLTYGDRIHLDGYFDARVTVEIDRLTASGARLFFHAPRSVRIDRVKLADQTDQASETANNPAGVAPCDREGKALERGDVCLLINPVPSQGTQRRVVVSAILGGERLTVRDLLDGPPIAVRPKDLVLYNDKTARPL